MADEAKSLLARVFERDRALAEAVTALVAADRRETLAAMSAAVDADRDLESEESDRRLVRIAVVLSDLEGRAAADVGVRLLDARSPVVRAAAGEALLDLAVDDPESVLDAALAALLVPTLSRAAQELPYLVAELAHPRSVSVVTKWLGHEDPAVVAAAIEALVVLHDPAAVPALEKLAKDPRVAHLEDEEEGAVDVPIASLAEDAARELGRHAAPRGRRR